MRKNDARKWLHAVLDLLPVLLIPIFAIYQNQMSREPISVEVPYGEVLDFNQRVNQVNITSSPVFGISRTSLDGKSLIVNGTSTQSSNFTVVPTFDGFDSEHIYYVTLGNVVLPQGSFLNLSLVDTKVDYRGLLSSSSFGISITSGTYIDVVVYPQVFDLTQMYGSGNEPSIEQFKITFPDAYYSYELSDLLYFDNVGTNLLNDADIGSQMVYTLYNSVDKYFNFGNIFNLGQVYNWFSVNIFGGNPPLVVPIVWNIVLYEFVMDLIFLLYALFMFFIDFCTNLIDRFNTKCSGGK